jgi:hypothetical protein
LNVDLSLRHDERIRRNRSLTVAARAVESHKKALRSSHGRRAWIVI